MIDYRVPKAIGGFNLQKLYTEILKSESTDCWYMQKYKDKTLITNYGVLYIVPGKFPLADGFIEEREVIKDLIPKWDDGVPCVDTKSEMALTDKTVVKVFRKDEKDIYFDKKYFKYFTDDTFEYRMSDSGKSLYIAYKGNLIAVILRINVSK
jgi:hypothetical protein